MELHSVKHLPGARRLIPFACSLTVLGKHAPLVVRLVLLIRSTFNKLDLRSYDLQDGSLDKRFLSR